MNITVIVVKMLVHMNIKYGDSFDDLFLGWASFFLGFINVKKGTFQRAIAIGLDS